MIQKQKSFWTLVTIVDPKCLPGQSIFDIIQVLLKEIKFEFVIVDDIQGSAEAINILEENENTVMNLKDFLKIVIHVKQFDWGDFFLFKGHPINWKNSRSISYPEVIVQTDTTVRAIDDGYIYIYTPYQNIVETIKKIYDIESVKTDFLENLDYPF